MGVKTYTVTRQTEDEIHKAYDAYKGGGQPGYSETYPTWPREVEFTDGTKGWAFDVTEYYG